MTNGEKLKEVFPCEIKEQPYRFGPSVFYEGLDFVKLFQKSWWNAEYKEPTTKNDLALIHTEGLDEEIRCTMCTNSMKSDRGCDGSCVVDKDMYKTVMDVIEKRIQPTTKNDLGVDCISRAEMLRYQQYLHGKMSNEENHKLWEFIKELPSVTPQPRKGHWIKSNIPNEGYVCSECGGAIWYYDYQANVAKSKYCPNCGTNMAESEEV